MREKKFKNLDEQIEILKYKGMKIHDENYIVGDCVCAGLNGEATVMTRDEIKEFPDRILGIITEIPEYEEWNGVKVNNRVWIKIR